MNARTRFILAVIVLCLLMTGPFILTAVFLMLDASDAERLAFAELLLPRLPLGTFLTLLGFVAGVMLLRSLFRQYVHGLMRMAEVLRLMLTANRHFSVTPEGPPEVRELARAANELAQQRNALLDDVDAKIREANAIEAEEKNRLAALMSEIALGVVVCNLDGRILLYNNRAKRQCNGPAVAPTTMGCGALIGLGRSIFSVLDRDQITHSLEIVLRRLHRGRVEPTANFITSTRTGQLLRVQMAPVLKAPDSSAGSALAETRSAVDSTVTGYVLTIENVTAAFEHDIERDLVLQTLTDDNRSALANIRAAAETVLDTPEMTDYDRQRFNCVIADEVIAMSTRLDDTLSRFSGSFKTRWPLEEVLAIDVLVAAARRIEDRLRLPIRHEDEDANLWILGDSFALIQVIAFLAERLREQYLIDELHLRLMADGSRAYIDLIWDGTAVPTELLHDWEMRPMQIGNETSALSLREVINRHGGEIWQSRAMTDDGENTAFLRVSLPALSKRDMVTSYPAHHPHGDDRPEYYDFDLFTQRDAVYGIDLDCSLTELVYTAFDTETTGLDPANGDDILQLGAVRIVNNRLLRQEVFDQLVDPGISIKPEAVRVHGITDSMVQGQPRIGDVLTAFHAFCAETVLVAHNGAFDMRFLEINEGRTGVRFAQPLLDTLLLSVVIHPHQESHQLESIAERMGVNVLGRHTALGDAFVTGEIFLKMIPLLADMGIVTLRQALDATQKTYIARLEPRNRS